MLECITVKPLIMDTPNNGHLPYNGPQSMYQPLFLSQYVLYSRIADNLRIRDNGQGSCITRLFSNRSAPPNNGQVGGAQQLVCSLSVSAYVALTDAVGRTGACTANKSHTTVVHFSTTISLFL